MIQTAVFTVLLLFCHYASGETTGSSSFDQLNQKVADTQGHEKGANGQASRSLDSFSRDSFSPDSLPASLSASLPRESFHDQSRAIDRLVSLSDHHFSLELFELAIRDLKEAQSRLHSLHGVHTTAQIPILEKLTASYARNNQMTLADRTEQFRFDLVQRHYPRQSLTVLSATYRLARWQTLRGRYMDALFTFEEGIRIIDSIKDTASSPALREQRTAFTSAADEVALQMYAEWDKSNAGTFSW